LIKVIYSRIQKWPMNSERGSISRERKGVKRPLNLR